MEISSDSRQSSADPRKPSISIITKRSRFITGRRPTAKTTTTTTVVNIQTGKSKTFLPQTTSLDTFALRHAVSCYLPVDAHRHDSHKYFERIFLNFLLRSSNNLLQIDLKTMKKRRLLMQAISSWTVQAIASWTEDVNNFLFVNLSQFLYKTLAFVPPSLFPQYEQLSYLFLSRLSRLIRAIWKFIIVTPKRIFVVTITAIKVERTNLWALQKEGPSHCGEEEKCFICECGRRRIICSVTWW